MKNWKLIAGSMVLAGAMAAPMATLAFGGPGPHHHKGHYMERLAEELNLTEGQKAQLKANREAAREERKAQREQKRELHEKLRQAIESGADQSTLDSLAAELGRLQVAEMQRRYEQRKQFEAILTDEQKAKLEELREKRKERRKERRERRGRGF